MDMEIKRSLQKGTVPLFKRLWEKAENNKHKIGLFVALIVSLNLEPLYTFWKLYVPPLQIRKALRESLDEPRETNFKSKLKNELILEFLRIDRENNYGMSRRLIMKAFKEMMISPNKEERLQFYKSGGHGSNVSNVEYLKLNSNKLSSVNLKEFQFILQQTYERNQKRFESFEKFQESFKNAVLAHEFNEKQHQEKQPKMKLSMERLPMKLRMYLTSGEERKRLVEELSAMRKRIIL